MRQVANRILIVDDSQKFRAAAAEMLAARGFELIEEAADGNEALSAIARACPDAILLDINLPGRDGLAVAASLAFACPRATIMLTSSEVDRIPAPVLKTAARRCSCRRTNWPLLIFTSSSPDNCSRRYR